MRTTSAPVVIALILAVPSASRAGGAPGAEPGQRPGASAPARTDVPLPPPPAAVAPDRSRSPGLAPNAGSNAPGAGRRVEASGVEVAIRKLADGLAAGFGRLPGSARYRRLAVLAFTEEGPQAKERRLGAVVTAELATDLRRDHDLLLVEREKLGQVLAELKLQQMTGAVPVADLSRLGSMADAQAVVVGSVADAGDRFLVNARIVAVGGGETLAAESVSVPAAGLVALASDAVVLRTRSDALYRSLISPGWGQFYNRQPAKAWLVIGTEVALVGGAVAYHLAGRSAYDDYLAKDSAGALGGSPSAEAKALYDRAASRYRTRNWLVGGAAAVWVLNVADAWLSGVDGESLLGGRVAAAPVVLPGGGGLVAVARF